MHESGPAQVKFTIPLRELSRADTARAGTKAATLGELSQAGFPVPDGFVVTTAAFERFLAHNGLVSGPTAAEVEACAIPKDVGDAIGLAAVPYTTDDAPLAVRSSSVAEDLAAASYAGQYETVLGVNTVLEILDAVRWCWISAFSPRVARYTATRTEGPEAARVAVSPGPASHTPNAMAVLVQRQIEPTAAGVAFTADPVTGNGRDTLISAVRGLGDRLVSGQAAADEWVVHERSASGVPEAVLRAAPERALTAAQALDVAALARRVERHFGAPQDIEWAVCDGELFLLQARPITGLPVSAATSAGVVWQAPYPGGWARNFRFGEWLGDPITPLFETWFLPVAERSFWAGLRRVADMPTPRPTYVVVHGWYFTSMNFWPPDAFGWLARLARHPRLLRVLLQFNPALAEWALRPWVREWQSAGLPRYRAIVEAAEEHVDRLGPDELVQCVDRVAEAAGDYFVWIALVAGAGYKTEAPLARFYRRHLYPTLGGSHQQLLAGLAGPAGPVAPHAVHSLDWSQPTFGEMVLAQETVGVSRNSSDRAASVGEARERAEAEARAVLARQARRSRTKEFERVLANAQRYARLREDIISQFTLGWPVLRRIVRRLGDELVQKGALDRADDIFFLTQKDVTLALQSSRSVSMSAQVSDRRQMWNSQRLLVPPLLIGEIPRELQRGLNQLETTLAPAAPHAGLKGLPASAGRALGPARIIRSSADFDRLQVGDVLVAPATTPAWTPLFGRAAAVITDTGSILAHASLVAREYGIPAVVGTGDATVRLRDGQQVLVDGMTGIVEVRSESAR